MNCFFCKKELPPVGTTLFVKKTGQVLHFCSSKCEKSHLMKRDPRKKKWSSKKKE